MEDKQVQQSPDVEQWGTTSELPPDVFSVLHRPARAINSGSAITPIAIVATVDSDGKPRTAPFGSLRAITPQLLRLACGNWHDTYANLCRDGQVSVAVLAPPNIAVSIRGRARIVNAKMDSDEDLVAVEVYIEEVKNDMLRRGIIESAIGFTPPENIRSYYIGIIAEIEEM